MSKDYEIRKVIVDYDVEDIRQRYLKLYSGQVFDAMALLGLHKNVLAVGFYPLDSSMKLAGPAFTARYIKTPEINEEKRIRRLQMIDSMTPGCIQVRQTQGDMACGQFGEVSATAAKAAGCVGALIEGTIRDSLHLMSMGFPTICRGRTPVEAVGNILIDDYQIPVFFPGVDGKVEIRPGDYIFGDNDGVVVIPMELTVKVLEMAENIKNRENVIRSEMAKGSNPVKVYNDLGNF